MMSGMRTIKLTFGAFVEISNSKDVQGDRIRSVIRASGRALDMQSQGISEADALIGLAEYYEHIARNLRDAAQEAARKERLGITAEQS
jgi:hypothetical protein